MNGKQQRTAERWLTGTALVCCVLALFLRWYAADLPKIARISLPVTPHMTRAELAFLETEWTPVAVLVLAPGYNGDGSTFLRDPKWRDFAARHRLGVVGLSFASELNDLQNGKGYYYVKNGSGEVLFDGLRRIYGRDLPLLLYGFSGGAHFTARLVEWRPERVLGWCAYAAGWWDEPQPMENPPPGIVACGRLDSRFQASFEYYEKGRELGRPWLWVGIENGEHVPCPELEGLVLECFALILRRSGGAGPGVAERHDDETPSAPFQWDLRKLPKVSPRLHIGDGQEKH